MRFFTHFSAEQLMEASIAGNDAQLDAFHQEKEDEYLNASLERWRSGNVGFEIPREEVHPSDLILIYAAQQQALLHQITCYTSDCNVALKLVDEINAYYTKASDQAFQVLTDIREEAAQQLKDSEHQFRSIAQSAFDGIMITDSECRILYVNTSMVRLFGYDEEELTDMNLSQLLERTDFDVLQKMLAKIRDEQSKTRMGHLNDITGIDKKAEKVPLDIATSTWLTRKGWLYSFILHDISKMKAASNALEEKAAELASSNLELEQFAYIASHDLKEPLRTVSNFTQLLGREVGTDNQRINDFMHHIMDGARRMDKLISNLLEFSRISRQGKNFEQIDLNAIIGQMKENLSTQIADANANLIIDELPVVNADPTQMSQLFQNLVSNGLKFNIGKTPTVTIQVKTEKDLWHFTVTDNGIGIPKEYSDKIFAMFQRVHSQYRGTGIGLAICKRIVEHHGGAIWFESEENKGTTFHFTLPQAEHSGATAPN